MGIKTKPIQSPFAPLKDVAGIYLKQALLDIQLNFQKQRIYPTEVYRGYEKVNQYRREHGQWGQEAMAQNPSRVLYIRLTRRRANSP